MARVAAGEEVQRVAARNIIERLRRGSVPGDQGTYFTVGRERWLSIIEDDLTNEGHGNPLCETGHWAS